MGSVVLGAEKERMMNPCDSCCGNTANPECIDGLILCDDCRDKWEQDEWFSDEEKEMAYAEHMRDLREDR